MKIHESRSERAKKIDEAKKAKIADNFIEWAMHPDRYDLYHVDFPIGKEFTSKLEKSSYPLFRSFKDKYTGWEIAHYKLYVSGDTVCIGFQGATQVTKKPVGEFCFRDKFNLSQVENYIKEHFKEPLAKKMISMIKRDLKPFEHEIREILEENKRKEEKAKKEAAEEEKAKKLKERFKSWDIIAVGERFELSPKNEYILTPLTEKEAAEKLKWMRQGEYQTSALVYSNKDYMYYLVYPVL